MTRLAADPNPASRRQARLGQMWLAWLRIRRNRLAMAGLAIVGLLLVVAALAPWIAPHDPLVQNLAAACCPPARPATWLGTDDFGRDILSPHPLRRAHHAVHHRPGRGDGPGPWACWSAPSRAISAAGSMRS
jgi:ABC-type antimicrobial peptide transport system permease subunit